MFLIRNVLLQFFMVKYFSKTLLLCYFLPVNELEKSNVICFLTYILHVDVNVAMHALYLMFLAIASQCFHVQSFQDLISRYPVSSSSLTICLRFFVLFLFFCFFFLCCNCLTKAFVKSVHSCLCTIITICNSNSKSNVLSLVLTNNQTGHYLI